MATTKRPVDVHTSGDRHQGGRRPDSSRDDELRGAALTLLAEIGYERLTMDAIAASAGAGKATLYRRWSGKAELVIDAIISAKNHVDLPDTGSLRGDLVALYQRDEENQLDAQVMVGLVGAMARDQELRSAFQERMIAPMLRVLTEIFRRAIDRGEIDPVENLERVVSVVPAYFLYRHIVFGDGFDSSTFNSILEDVLLPLVRFRTPVTRV
jgi:AcrR family transcriptional regulator